MNGEQFSIQDLIDKNMIVAHKDGNYGSNYPKKSEFNDHGVLFLTAKNLDDSGNIDFSSAQRLNDEKAKKLTFGYIQSGDVLLSHNATVGRVAIVPELDEPVLVGTSLTYFRINHDKLIPRYFAGFLSSRDFQNQLKSVMSFSTRNQVPITLQRTLNVRLPEIDEQRKIGNFVSFFDQKLELNQKINQTLEDIAKAIFKSWFVDFDPVRAKMEGRPTGLPPEIDELFPDELVDSEIGEIPKGWKVGELSDVADITMGQSPPGDTYNDDGIGLPFYQGSTDFGFRFPSLRKYCSESKRLANADDVLISVRAPVGDLNRAKEDCCIGRGLASVRAKNSLQSWVFYRCKSLSQQLEMFNSEGTVFGSINGKDLKGLPTVLATDSLCKSFEELCKPIDDAVRNRTLEIEVLNELRDTLLPKLISGELRIPDAEKFLEEAGI